MTIRRTTYGTPVRLLHELGCGLWLCEVLKGGYRAVVHEDDLQPTN